MAHYLHHISGIEKYKNEELEILVGLKSKLGNILNVKYFDMY